MARSLGTLSFRWLNRKNPYRRRALRAMSGDFPGEMGEALLDALFSELTEKKLLAVARSDPGAFRAAIGGLIVHVVPANVPNPSVTSVILGLLARAANAVKISKRDSGILRVYHESLRAHDPALARAVAVFSSRREAIARMRDASLAVVYGDDDTVAHLRRRVPKGLPFVAYGHRASVAVFAKEALGGRLARAAARDAWMMDRRGCMSPDVFFVQAGGPVSPRSFSVMLDKELEKRRVGEAVSFDRALRLKASHDRGRLAAAKGESLSARVPVRAFQGPEDLARALSRYRGKLQTVALEAPLARRKRFTALFARLGVSRVCRAGRMQHPPLSWDHERTLSGG